MLTPPDGIKEPKYRDQDDDIGRRNREQKERRHARADKSANFPEVFKL